MVPFRISVVSYRVVYFTERFHCKLSLSAARGAISNATSIQINESVKHIRTKFWFIKTVMEEEDFTLKKVHTFWQLADFGTKIHNATTWQRLLEAIHNFDPAVDYSTIGPDD